MAIKKWSRPQNEKQKIIGHAQVVEAMDGTPVPACKACGDTGVNSKGGPCVPCIKAGRVLDDSKLNDPFA